MTITPLNTYIQGNVSSFILCSSYGILTQCPSRWCSLFILHQSTFAPITTIFPFNVDHLLFAFANASLFSSFLCLYFAPHFAIDLWSRRDSRANSILKLLRVSLLGNWSLLTVYFAWFYITFSIYFMQAQPPDDSSEFQGSSFLNEPHGDFASWRWLLLFQCYCNFSWLIGSFSPQCYCILSLNPPRSSFMMLLLLLIGSCSSTML